MKLCGVLHLNDKHSLVLLKKTITFDLEYLKKMLAERRPNNYKRKKTDKQIHIGGSVEQEQTQALRPGGGILPIMAYTGRLRPKGVPFSGFTYIKG